MKGHPELDVVSRDRAEDYAAAARKGAPQARQVADRFHLARHAERSDRYQQLVELRAQGLTYQDIARRLGMGERTVRRLPHTRDSLWETRASPQTTQWI
jgi:transposase